MAAMMSSENALYHTTAHQSGGKTSGLKHVFEVEFCASLLLDGNSIPQLDFHLPTSTVQSSKSYRTCLIYLPSLLDLLLYSKFQVCSFRVIPEVISEAHP